MDVVIKKKLIEPIGIPEETDYRKSDPWSDTPETFWSPVTLSPEVKQIIFDSVGMPMKEDFWLWNFFGHKDLRKHKDPIVKYNGNHTHIVNICLEGTCETTIYNDDGSVLEQYTYGPGDITIFEHTKYFHSGRVLEGNKIMLCGYLVDE